MTWKVLITAPYMQPVLDTYRLTLEAAGVEIVVPPVSERMSESELLEWIADIDGVICGDDAFTERVMSAAPKLKVISKWGTGIDSIDQDAAARHGIAVRNTPNAFSEPVADSVLGYMLAFARQIPWMDRDIRAGSWTKRPAFALREATLGIIGVGNVGKAVARRAAAFGMTLLGNDVVEVDPGFLRETGMRMVSKKELLGASRFVSLNCDLNPTSWHIMDTAALTTMEPNSYLINTARGQLVNEKSLAIALPALIIAGAALDVFEDEPLPADSPLRQMDNCLLAPHNANGSPEAWQRVHESTINNLLESLRQASTRP